MDKLLKSISQDGSYSICVIEATDMINQAIKIHGLSPVCAAATGRTMMAATFMSSSLKNADDKLTIVVKGDGPCGKITVCGNSMLQMRGTIDNANVYLPLRADKKLNVGGCVGKNGKITVIKSMGLKEPYSGSSKLVSGEIAEDFAAYYAFSEQQPTAMALGVKIDTDTSCMSAGGVVVQALPNASEEELIKAENIIKGLSDISSVMKNLHAEGVIKQYFGITDFAEYYPKYECLCSREYIEKVIISLGKKEAEDIIKETGKIEVNCQFCGKKYVFCEQDLEKIFN